MNFTNDSGDNDNERNSSSDEDEEIENIYPSSSSSVVEKCFSDDDDENYHLINRRNRLCTILRQSNQLVELKLNLLHRQTRSDSDLTKSPDERTRLRRLYLPSSLIEQFRSEIIHWLEASTCLIDSISTSTYHRQCWSQLLLTYFIERRLVNLQFSRCTDSCSRHQYTCIPEEDAYKLSSILQKGSKFHIDSNIFDHLRRIIVIKSMQETFNDNTNLQQLYVKQLTSLKQSLTNANTNLSTSVASMYSKVLLFLSSLYSIKAETMQTLFCQHLLHNPMYSYLITS